MKACKGRFGGDGGIRTLDTPLRAYNGLANRRLQPLGHVSGEESASLALNCQTTQGMWAGVPAHQPVLARVGITLIPTGVLG
jgi:hypothetical protein